MNDEPDEQPRFQFGKNWSYFLRNVDDQAIKRAEDSLREALAVDDLAGRSFLDIGSGSGLFSLAAWRLGAAVHSIDIDEESVACTRTLKQRFAADSDRWKIEHGSVLDRDFFGKLGTFDIVYSWGVLHHTGQMWQAIENAIGRVAQDGRLFIAIYNDQGRSSVRWTKVKRLYNALPRSLRFTVLVPAFVRIWGPTMLRDFFTARPFHTWRTYQSNRGMNAWRDFIDWVGGYPFEVAKPEEIVAFCAERGLAITFEKTCGTGRGCNEFVFTNGDSSGGPSSSGAC